MILSEIQEASQGDAFVTRAAFGELERVTSGRIRRKPFLTQSSKRAVRPPLRVSGSNARVGAACSRMP